jgi:hypothetical protein
MPNNKYIIVSSLFGGTFSSGADGVNHGCSGQQTANDEKRKAPLIGLLQSQTRPFVSLSKRKEHVENVL